MLFGHQFVAFCQMMLTTFRGSQCLYIFTPLNLTKYLSLHGNTLRKFALKVVQLFAEHHCRILFILKCDLSNELYKVVYDRSGNLENW